MGDGRGRARAEPSRAEPLALPFGSQATEEQEKSARRPKPTRKGSTVALAPPLVACLAPPPSIIRQPASCLTCSTSSLPVVSTAFFISALMAWNLPSGDVCRPLAAASSPPKNLPAVWTHSPASLLLAFQEDLSQRFSQPSVVRRFWVVLGGGFLECEMEREREGAAAAGGRAFLRGHHGVFERREGGKSRLIAPLRASPPRDTGAVTTPSGPVWRARAPERGGGAARGEPTTFPPRQLLMEGGEVAPPPSPPSPPPSCPKQRGRPHRRTSPGSRPPPRPA